MTAIKPPTGYRAWPEDKPVAVVLTLQVCLFPAARRKQVHAELPQQVMWTAFEGEDAMKRAKAFMESEQERDFTAKDGWHWTIWGNQLAYEEYADFRTEEMFGPPSQEEQDFIAAKTPED